MQTAEYNYEDFESQQQRKMDEGLLVRFYVKPVQDQRASNEQGKPVFKDVEIIEIRVPGQKSFVAHPVNTNDIKRFPRHWEAYKSRTGDTEYLEGTPLKEWPLVTRSQAEELSFANVKTVEQLAAMPDSNASSFMGMNMLRAKAKEWLENAAEFKKAAELKAQLSKRDEEIETLKAQMADLMKAKKPATRKKRAKKKTAAKKE